MIYTGVDPGKNGAIVSLSATGEILKVSKFAEVQPEGRIALVIADHIAALALDTHSACIERVGAMPRQGASSTFTFGRVYGEAWAGLLLAEGGRVRVQSVTPTQWQRDFGLPKRADSENHKRTLRELAENRFGRKFTLAEADAVWLAEWSRVFGSWARALEVTR